jgi:hypothetical protein
MLKKLLSLMLTCLLINVAASAAYPRSHEDEIARRFEKIKEDVRKLGVGEKARVEVKLHNGKKLKGYIREATDEEFVVVEEKTGTANTLIYAQVVRLNAKHGPAAKVGISVIKGMALVVGTIGIVMGIVYIFSPKS